MQAWLVDTGPSWLGLDSSWMMMMNHALIKHMVWGRDIIYNYGPLGFLSTRMGWGISAWVFILFDLFIVINFYFVFIDFIKQAYDKFMAILILVCTCLLLLVYPGSDLPWIISFLSFYWMYKAFKKPQLAYFIFIAILIALSFFIKLNTGLTGIIFLMIFLGILLIYKKIKPLFALRVLAIPIMLIAILALWLHVAIWDYVKGALEIIKGYNAVMYLDEDHKSLQNGITILFAGLMLMYTAFSIFLLRRRQYSALFFSGLSIIYLVLLHKQAILRNDVQHMGEFLAFAPLILLMGNLLYQERQVQRVLLSCSLVFILMALLINTERRTISTAFTERFGIWADYKAGIKEFSYKKEYLTQKDKRIIPQRVLDKIGKQSIDIFPWDCEYLLENKLNYTPRPVFQSFTVFTPYLQALNYDFYLKKAPQYIIYDYDAIDGRYPFNEECTTNLFISHNYEMADTFTSNGRLRLLLKKAGANKAVQQEELRKEIIEPDHDIALNGAGLVKIDLSYNLAGKLLSTFHRPPPIQIMMMKADGNWQIFKTSNELLKAGLYVDKMLNTTMDFASLISHKSTLPSILKIKIMMDKKYFGGATASFYTLK